MLKPSGGVLKKAFGGAAGGFVGKGAALRTKPTAAVTTGTAKPKGVLAGKMNRPLPSGSRFGTAGSKGAGSPVGRLFGRK